MASALIGYTGFVGSNLLRARSFDDLYNSSNIGNIVGKHYDLLVCAGVPAVKWKANKEPDRDREQIAALIDPLSKVTADRFILISTIDVYSNPSSYMTKAKILSIRKHSLTESTGLKLKNGPPRIFPIL